MVILRDLLPLSVQMILSIILIVCGLSVSLVSLFRIVYSSLSLECDF